MVAPTWLQRYMLCGHIADFTSFSQLTILQFDTHVYERTRNILDYVVLVSVCDFLVFLPNYILPL